MGVGVGVGVRVWVTFPAEPVVVALEHGAGHPKVRQLDRPAGVDQTVPTGNISEWGVGVRSAGGTRYARPSTT